MKRSETKQCSRLMLGTVQFGMEYGIGNESGRPEYRTCLAIVEAALEEGVRYFDTAADYGESERVLGRVLAELGAMEQAVIVSKCPPLRKMNGDPAFASVRAFVEDSLNQSLTNLGLGSLPVYLFHRELDVEWMEALAHVREKGLVGEIGVSVDTADGAMRVMNHSAVEALQIPYNLLDHRFSRGPVYEHLKKRGTHVFARSAFLQGLLLMPEERIPPHLGEVVPVRRKLKDLAIRAGMDMAELCLRYSLSSPAITHVLIGVDSVEQLRANAAAVRKGPLETDLLAAIETTVPDFSESMLRPTCWKREVNRV